MTTVENIYRLSPLQEGMLFHTLSDPDSGLYVEQSACTLEGDLDPAALRRAWEGVLARHPVLRASFHWEEVERPVQVVYREVELPWREEDWRGLPAEAQESRFAALVEADRRLGFDLGRAPLMRVALVRCGGRAWRFLWSHHHLLLDGWSVGRVLKEVFAGLAAGSEGAPALPPSRPYVDYIAWLDSQPLAEAEAFWRRELEGIAAPTPLPLASPAPPGSAGGAPRSEDRILALPPAESAPLEEAARRTGLTLGTLVQAAWAVLLARTTGEEDVVFGSVVSGRPPHLRGSESMVGLFINTLPVRVRVDEDEPLLPWLRRLQERLLELRRFEHSPLPQVQRWSGARAGEPLFHTMVAFENYPRDAALLSGGGGIAVRDLETFERTNYPLNLAAVPLDGLQLRLTYDVRSYGAEEAERLLGGLRNLLAGMAAGLDRRHLPLAELPLLGEAERRELLERGRGAVSEVPDIPLDVLLERTAAQRAEAPAVVSGDGAEWSYRRLFGRAAALAGRLAELGVGPEVTVGICLGRSPELVAAMLGVWKAGGVSLPLDPEHPAERLRFLLEDAAAAVLVTGEGGRGDLEPPPGCRVVRMPEEERPGPESSQSQQSQQSHQSHQSHSGVPGAAAYIIYTSGSTGRPKGVVAGHRGLVSFVSAARDLLRLGPGSRVPEIASPSFDASVLEIFPALLAGGTVCFLSRDTLLSGPGLADELRRLGITEISTVPSLLATLPEGSFPALRTVLSGAERCPPETAARWSAGRRFLNAYGPTEATVFATVHEGAGEPPLGPPIGRPIANAEVYVMDFRGRLVPAGAPGEIQLGGTGVARGYLRRPDLTAERFVPDPFSGRAGARLYRTGDLGRWRRGELEILGRLDQQVKVRGHRVECGEVEDALARHPAVRQAAVLGRPGVAEAGGTRLVAYVAGEDPPPAPGDLRRWLGERLPDWMIPAAWVFLDALPLSSAGKVDRRALARIDPEPVASAGGAAEAPQGETEETLARIWTEVLRVERVGRGDDFFELGGDSILSIQVVARAAEAGLRITPRQVFERPTVAALAEVAVAASAQTGAAAVAGPAPLTPIQRAFFERRPADPHWFNMPVLLSARGEGWDAAALERALGVLVERHDALRLRFEHRDGQWAQRVAAHGEAAAPLVRIDLAGLPAPRREAAFAAAAAELQGSLDLARTVVRAALFHGAGEDAGQRLLLLVHHLAVDAVSWRVLLEDLERAWLGGEEARLPAATAPFSLWAGRLEAHAGSPEAARELPFWRAQDALAAGRPPLPVDGGEGADLEGGSGRVTVALDAAATRDLLKEAHRAYQTRPEELLLAALAEAVAGWSGERTLWVDVEGHGREPGFPGAEGVDLSRTVGWLTTIHPLWLDLRPAGGPGEVVRAAKETVRRVPGRGLGYGVLRHLAGERFAAPPPEIAFNYLGQVDLLVGASPVFEVSPEVPGLPRSPRAARPYRLEVNAWVRDGRLWVDWGYGARRHRRETVERLAEGFLAALRGLVEHCLAPDAGGFTPSDFPAADLDQKALDKLLGKVGGKRR